ncbi:hypothetical protein D3C78_1815160 [compost metagenome]
MTVAVAILNGPFLGWVSALTSTTGTVAVRESDAVTSAVSIPDTVNAPLSGSYSITAPSGKAM